MAKKSTLQQYPRIDDEKNRYHGYLDEAQLNPHPSDRIRTDVLKKIITEAISYANSKSSRQVVDLPDDATAEQIKKEYEKMGKELYKYFFKYCADPAATAFECIGRSYTDIAEENFRTKTLQMERMNSGWRYQSIAKEAATKSKRFKSVSDIGLKEADFTTTINYINKTGELSIYISIKNRTDTLGGPDWPNAIAELEKEATNDKNRSGNYICVFGITMEKGQRNIKTHKKSNTAYSYNTEVWMSDFFWKFFSNYSYEEISKSVLEVLMKIGSKKVIGSIPQGIIDQFGVCCRDAGLVDEKGVFNNAEKFIEIACRKVEKPSKVVVVKVAKKITKKVAKKTVKK